MIKADLILSSKAVFTAVDDAPSPGAVAIKDNYIIAVGLLSEIRPYIGPFTKVYEFGDQLIMPGFQDFHIHLFLGGLSEDSVSLIDARSQNEAAEMVKVFADGRQEDEWIFGFRWYHVYWEDKSLPQRHSLDRLIPDRPVFLFNDECHGAWLNSKALKLLGIDKNTPDPPFGEILKDSNGEPTGFLYETAMGFAQKVFNNISIKQKERIFQSFLDKAARLGITTVSDMLPLPGLELGDLNLYKQFEDEDKLTTRIHFLTALNGDLERPKMLQEKFNSKLLAFSGLKQFLDGVPTTYTAYLLDSYSDNKNTRGITLIPPDVVKEWAIEADKEGFRLRFHACGDAAVRIGLDCFEAAQIKNGIRDSRHTIEHIEVIHPSDIDRFARLGVIASMQPEHMATTDKFENNVYLSRLGKERERFTWPIKTLKERGAKIALGTDYPVVGIEPLTEIYRAVSRLHDDGNPVGGWNPEEKLTIGEALKAYTINAAYGNFCENVTGTLEEGKLADVIVLNQNLFNVCETDIKETEVILTVMNGKIVFENQTLIKK
jgi:predicted amidohydrolase YtcJ